MSLLAGTVALIAVCCLLTSECIFSRAGFSLYLRVGAIDITILCIGHAYRSVLIGTAQYRGSAAGRAGR